MASERKSLLRAVLVTPMAQEMHRDYRATEKALGAGVHQHDHGWKACPNQAYFLSRALRRLHESYSGSNSDCGDIDHSHIHSGVWEEAVTDPKNTSSKDVAKRAAERIYRMYDHRGATEAVATIIREELVVPVSRKEALFASYQAALKAS